MDGRSFGVKAVGGQMTTLTDAGDAHLRLLKEVQKMIVESWAGMSGIAVARALSSDVNWSILDVLVLGKASVSEISTSLGLPLKHLRPRLQELIQVGLVVADEEPNASGRVSHVYRLTRTAKSVGFPPRNYEFLSEALIHSLAESLGEDGARMVLRDIGLRIGERVGQALTSRIHPTRLDPNAYAEQFVKGFLAEMRMYPQLVSVGKRQVVYGHRNCLFQELAGKFPGLVCDVLDKAVHEGTDRKLGVKTTRLWCMGHGDPICKYSVAWPKSRR